MIVSVHAMIGKIFLICIPLCRTLRPPCSSWFPFANEEDSFLKDQISTEVLEIPIPTDHTDLK